jgi:hypothetical protein
MNCGHRSAEPSAYDGDIDRILVKENSLVRPWAQNIEKDIRNRLLFVRIAAALIRTAARHRFGFSAI